MCCFISSINFVDSLFDKLIEMLIGLSVIIKMVKKCVEEYILFGLFPFLGTCRRIKSILL